MRSLADEVAVRHEAKETGIAQIDGIVSPHPIVVLGEPAGTDRNPIHLEFSPDNLCPTVLMNHQSVSQQGDVPRSDLDERSS